jgi:pimeloyl-ACP methyl ester carboxylesterase
MAVMRQSEFRDRGWFVRWTDLPGRMPARVFVHGLGCLGGAIFGGVAGHPELGGHRTIVIDLPGHGLSDRPGDWGYSLEDHTDAVAAVCADAGVERVDLLGHSLGGDIAITVVGRHPGLVGRLVVAEANLDPIPRIPTGGRASQRIAAQTEEAFVRGGYQELVETVPSWSPMLRLCDARAVYRSAVGLVTGTRPTMRTVFTTAGIPRMFIVGDAGEPLVDAAGLEAAGVHVVTIQGAGHMMMADQPEAFVRAIAAAFPD